VSSHIVAGGVPPALAKTICGLIYNVEELQQLLGNVAELDKCGLTVEVVQSRVTDEYYIQMSKENQSIVCERNPTEFKLNCICLYTDLDHDVFEAIKKYKEGSEKTVESKTSSHDSHLADKKNEKWVGVLSPIAAGMREHDFGFLPTPFEYGDKGCSAWCCTSKANSYRMGAAAWPVPGAGTLVHTLNADIYIVTFKIESLLSSGLLLQDVAKYLANADGASFLEKEGAIIHLQAGQAAYLPWGYFAMPLYYVNDAKAGSWSHVWTLVIAEKAAVADDIVTPSVCKAIGTFNIEHCKTSKESFWNSRRCYLEKFFAHCGVALK
jgi:hypothetical protein